MRRLFERIDIAPLVYFRILGVALIAAFYPAIRASLGKPVDVLRSL